MQTITLNLPAALRLIRDGQSFITSGDGWQMTVKLKRKTWHCECNSNTALSAIKSRDVREVRQWVKDWWVEC